jgi:hypothetical protein
MAKTIYKYTIDQTPGGSIFQMPAGWEIISAQEQDGSICIWAIVDPEKKPTDVWIAIYGTGSPLRNINQQFIATVQMNDGLVWHLFLVH